MSAVPQSLARVRAALRGLPGATSLQRLTTATALCAALLLAPTAARADPVNVTVLGSGVLRPTDLECGRQDAPPICFTDHPFTVELTYLDPGRSLSNVLGLDAILSFSLQVFRPQGGAVFSTFRYPPAQPAATDRYSAEILDSEDTLSLAFSGLDGRGAWSVGHDGSVRVDNLHGEGFAAAAGALSWKVPTPGTAWLAGASLLALCGQRRLRAMRNAGPTAGAT